MKEQVTIRYPNENFGPVSVSINEIFMDQIEKNQVKTFDLFAGQNEIQIHVTGTSYEKDSIKVENGKEYVIEGYFSKQRLIGTLVAILGGAVTILIISFWNSGSVNWKLYGIFSIVIIISLITKWVIDFKVKKMKYVYLKRVGSL